MTTEAILPDSWLAPLRSGYVCLDTMIVRHLVVAGGGDDLAQALDGRMLWPDAVGAELRVQARKIPRLQAFMADRGRAAKVELFGADDDEEIADIRLEMYKKRDLRLSDTEHLGEAQCIFVCKRDGLPLLSQDNKARVRARAVGIRAFLAVDVLQLMVRLGLRKPGEAWTLYEEAVNVSGLYDWAGFPVATSRDRFLTDASAMRAMYLAERTTGAA